jgi:hypothetical protein
MVLTRLRSRQIKQNTTTTTAATAVTSEYSIAKQFLINEVERVSHGIDLRNLSEDKKYEISARIINMLHSLSKVHDIKDIYNLPYINLVCLAANQIIEWQQGKALLTEDEFYSIRFQKALKQYDYSLDVDYVKRELMIIKAISAFL